MKLLTIASFFILSSLHAVAQNITTQQYIDTFKNIAEEEMKRTGVPAAISLAQGIVETDSGNGWLVEHSNNHFGVKCKNDWQGKTILYDDDKKNECFRKYDNAVDSWKDHSDFLKNNARYAFLFQLDPLDYKDWASGLKEAGYATSKVYAERLIKTIEEYDLQQYSLEALGMRSAEKGNAFSAMLNKVVKKEENDYNSTHPKQVKTVVTPPPPAAAAYSTGIFSINDKKVIYARKGSSLMEVAETHRLKLRKLLKYNELQNDGPLSDDRLLYLEKKGKTGAHEVHEVQEGEDMYIISQKEGIRLKWLYKRNRMKRGEEPATGEKLLLQGRAAHSPRLSGEPGKAASGFLINKDTSAPKRQWPAVRLEKKSPVSPDKAAAVPDNSGQTDKTADYTENKPSYHVVQPKETLYGLSKKFKVSVAQLQQWNGLSGTDIKIGQKLIVNK